jgi:hypothetical protein
MSAKQSRYTVLGQNTWNSSNSGTVTINTGTTTPAGTVSIGTTSQRHLAIEPKDDEDKFFEKLGGGELALEILSFDFDLVNKTARMVCSSANNIDIELFVERLEGYNVIMGGNVMGIDKVTSASARTTTSIYDEIEWTIEFKYNIDKPR